MNVTDSDRLLCLNRDNSQGLDLLIRWIERVHGLDCSHFRRSYLERRTLTRLRANGCASYVEYRALLKKDESEQTRLLQALTVNLSGFFRDAEVWRTFANKITPDLIQRKRTKRHRLIRIWSAGCATGEEPYSIAMVLDRALGQDRPGYLVSIYGTDIDEDAIAAAKRGVYPLERATGVPPQFAAHYLRPVRQGVAVSPQLHSMVKFKALNLFADNMLKVVDVVFCRNVLIYFTRQQQARLLEYFDHALVPNGVLIIGKTEKLVGPAASRFRPLDASGRIYEKVGQAG